MNIAPYRRSGALVRRRLAIAALSCVPTVVVLAPTAGASTDPRVAIGRGEPLGHGASVTALPATVSFSVVLRPGHAEELARFLSDVSTPGSSLYHHYLQRGQFAQRFGPSRAERDRVSSFFRGYSLRVLASRDNTLALTVSGRPRDVARAFAARLVAVRAYGSVATQFAGSATLPRDVARDLSGVAGLSTWRRPHETAQIRPSAIGAHASAHTITLPGTCTAANAALSPPGPFLPAQQAHAYGINRQWTNGFNATGQTIAVYELTNYLPSDISTYFSCFGLSPSITDVGVDGGPSFGDTTPQTEIEAALDIEEAGVLAPGANLLVYKGPNNNVGPIDVYGAIAAADQASVVTTSWGMCETASGQASAIAAEAPYFQQMAAQGQSVMAAAGDDGSSDCAQGGSDYGVNVDDPASQPYVTGVGGLTVNSIAAGSTPLSESVWNDGGGAGGGGVSQIWAQPKWQTGDHVPNLGHRLVPDLSVMGDPATGFVTYATGAWLAVGGTSIGSPLMAAVVATANQVCGGPVGFINPTIYQMAANGIGFNDVTSGNNQLFFEAGTSKTGVANYSAGPGYDMASGLGSPDPATFIPGLCGALPTSATSSVVVTPSTPIPLSSSVRVTVTARNAAHLGIGYLSPIVTATEPGALPVITPLSASTNSLGAIAYLVSTAVPGTVTISASIGSVTLGTTEVNFVSTSRVVTRALASLHVPAANQRSAGTGGGQYVVVGVDGNGHLLSTVSPTQITDVSARWHLARATGAPAVGCAGASCLALIDVGGHLVGIFNVNTPATSRVVDFGQRYSAAAHVLAGSIALDDRRGSGYFDVSFLNPAHHVLLAHYSVASGALSFTNLTAKDHLGLSFGATAIVDASATQHYVAARVKSSYWLIADGVSSGAEDVAAATHLSTAGSSSLTSAPSLVIDAASGEISLLARSARGSVVLFTSTTGAPHRLSHYVIVSYGGATSQGFAAGPTGTSHDVVIYTSGGRLRLASYPSWQSFEVVSPARVTDPVVIPGPRPLVLGSGGYYSVTP